MALFLVLPSVYAHAAGSPAIGADLVGDFVDGFDFTPGATLTVKAFTAPGGTEVVSRTALVRGDGGFFIDLDPVDLVPGMAVQVTEPPSIVRDLTLVPLAITGVNLTDDEVSGTADTGTSVNVNVNSPGAGGFSETVVASGGAWTAFFTGDHNIVSGTVIQANVPDGDGDSTRVSLGPANIGADPNSDNVDGNGFTPSATLTITVFDAPAGTEIHVATTPADDEGRFFRSLQPFNLAPGNAVQVTDGVFTKDLTVVPISITGVDYSANTVTGTATEGTTVNVNVFGPAPDTGAGENPVAQPGDVWTATFSFDIVPGAGFDASISDGDGDRSHAGKGPASIGADLSFDNINVNGFAPNSTLDLTISGGASFGPASFPTDAQGNAFINRQQHGVDLVPGLTIDVTQGGATKTLVTATLAISLANPITDDVTGTADPGASVQVNVGDGPGPQDFLFPVADGSGNWTADFSGIFDITGTSHVNAHIHDADGDSTGFGKGAAAVGGDVSANNINVNNFVANSTVLVEISGDASFGPTSFPTDAIGNAFISSFQHNVDLVPGLTVTATQGSLVKTLVLADLSISLVNTTTDDVTGTAPNGTAVNVNVFGPVGAFQTVTAGPGDTWTADFTGIVDIAGMSQANASIPDPDGDSTNAFKAPAVISGDLFGDVFNVNSFQAGSTVTVQISGAASFGPTAFPTDAFGSAFIGRQQHNVDLVPGLTLTATQGSLTKTLVLENLSITTVDASSEQVSGTADEGTSVNVSVFGLGGFSFKDVTAGPGNTWTAAFSPFDITPTMGANAQIQDTDGDATTYGKGPSTVDGDLSCDCIRANGFTPSSTLSVEISGASSFGPASFPTDAQGNAFLDRSQLADIDLVPGLTITVIQGSVTKTLVLENLSITGVDTTNDDVSGTADEGTTVQVNVGDESGGDFREVVAAAGNTWTVDFSPFNITPTMGAGASIRDADGDSTSTFANPPTIDGQLTCDCISGNGFAPSSTVSLEISGASSFGPASFPTDAQGNFFLDRSQLGDVDLVPGLTITVIQGSVTKTLVLENLSITGVDVTNDDVSGTADEGTTVQVNVGDESGGDFREVVAVVGNTWTADFSPFNITPTMGAGAHIRDADGDTTSTFANPPTIDGDLSCDCISGNGFAPSSTVSLEISGGASFGPASFPTDAQGNFFLDRGQFGDVDLVPGLTITAIQDSVTKTLVLANLSITAVDVTNDDVSGTADEGTTVQVDVGDESGGDFKEVVAVAGNTWTADFSPFNITPTMGAGAHIRDADGDSTNTFASPPTIEGDLSCDCIGVQGFAPSSTVSLEISGAASFGPQSFPTDAQGNLFVDRSQFGDIDLVPGLTITVTQGSVTKTLVLANLSISLVNPNNEQVTGLADEGTVVQVDVGNDTGGGFTEATAGTGDTWTADFSGGAFNITFGAWAGARIPDADGDMTTFGKGTPNINGNVSCDCLGGRDFLGNSTVTLTISGGGGYGPAPAPTDADGNWGVDFSVTGVDLVPGITITATQGTITKTLVLTDLTISIVDPGANQVTGTAPEGTAVSVNVGDESGEEGHEVVAQAGDTWSATFTSFDIHRNSHVNAEAFDSDKDFTNVDKGSATIEGRLGSDEIGVMNFVPNSTVSVQISGASTFGPASFPTDQEGNASIGFGDHGVDLVPGLTITVTQGSYTKTLTLAPLTVDVVDPATDVVSGTATPGAPVHVVVPFIVEIERCCPEIDTTADGSGSWTTDFTGIDSEVLDVLEPASSAFAEIIDAEGDATVMGRAATEESSGTVPPGGGTVDTDPEGDGATPSDPVETSVTTDGAGSVTIEETQTTGTAPDAFSFLDYQIDITAPPQTANDPLVLVFRIDASLIPEGETAATIQVFRNGVLVQACNGQAGNATPNPCVSNRQTLGDGDVEITVLTSDASEWNFGIPDGPAPVIALSSATYGVDEGGGSATITVDRSGGTAPAGATYTISDGTATDGTDYTASSATVSFAEGETTKTFQVPVLDDARFEGSETVQIALSAPTGGAVLGALAAATLTIQDNDTAPVLQLSTGAVSVAENAGTADLTVARTGATDNEVQVDYALGPGSATLGSDFTFSPGTLSFAAGETAKIISIPIVNDTLGESPETLSVRLSNPAGGATLGSPNQATVTIETSDQQPDAQILGAKKRYIGDDVFNLDALGQAVETDARAGQTKTFFARVYNDGTATNTFAIRGTPAPAGSTIVYRKGNADITADMTSAGGFQFTLGKGQYVEIKIVITVGSSDVEALVTASWTGDVVLEDAVRATVHVTG